MANNQPATLNQYSSINQTSKLEPVASKMSSLGAMNQEQQTRTWTLAINQEQ